MTSNLFTQRTIKNSSHNLCTLVLVHLTVSTHSTDSLSSFLVLLLVSLTLAFCPLRPPCPPLPLPSTKSAACCLRDLQCFLCRHGCCHFGLPINRGNCRFQFSYPICNSIDIKLLEAFQERGDHLAVILVTLVHTANHPVM